MKNKNKELLDLLTIIQTKTKKTKGEIADEVGYSRSHLSLALNNHLEGEYIINRLKTHYAEFLDEKVITKNRQESFERMMLAVSKTVLVAVAEVIANQKKAPVQAIVNQLQDAVQSELKRMP
jgi:DNA-binding transcriptional regulator GbsR (MarR family)